MKGESMEYITPEFSILKLEFNNNSAPSNDIETGENGSPVIPF